jgi:hypothetical protein
MPNQTKRNRQKQKSPTQSNSGHGVLNNKGRGPQTAASLLNSRCVYYSGRFFSRFFRMHQRLVDEVLA